MAGMPLVLIVHGVWTSHIRQCAFEESDTLYASRGLRRVDGGTFQRCGEKVCCVLAFGELNLVVVIGLIAKSICN